MTVPPEELSKRLQDLIINPLSKIERDDLCLQAADFIDDCTQAEEAENNALWALKGFANEIIDLLFMGPGDVEAKELQKLAEFYELISGSSINFQKTKILMGE